MFARILIPLITSLAFLLSGILRQAVSSTVPSLRQATITELPWRVSLIKDSSLFSLIQPSGGLHHLRFLSCFSSSLHWEYWETEFYLSGRGWEHWGFLFPSSRIGRKGMNSRWRRRPFGERRRSNLPAEDRNLLGNICLPDRVPESASAIQGQTGTALILVLLL